MRERKKTAGIVRACRGFAAANGGSTAVEYAAILTMVVGLSYVAYAMLHAPLEGRPSQVAEVASGNDARSTWPQLTALIVTLLAAGALIFDRRRAKTAVDLQEPGLSSPLQANFIEKRQQILRMLTGHTRRRPGESITVRHLMTTKLTTVATTATVEEICRLMHGARIHHLLVVREGRELLGIISDRDIAHRSGRSAADVMTRNPLTVTPETPAIQAITMMLGGRFSCVPVIESDTLVGLLTTTDLMMALQCTLQILTQSLQSFLADSPVEVKGARYFARVMEQVEEDRLAGTANG